MKKFITFLFVIFTDCNCLLGQDNLVVFLTDAIADSVPVFHNDTTAECFTKIKEDQQKENWHDVEILGVSDNRYKVHIIPLNDTKASIIDGWLYKEQCGVWLLGRYIKDGLFIVRLYAKPGQPSPIIRLYDKMLDDFGKYTNGKAVPVLDFKLYQGHYWIKTVIVKNHKRIVGWTRDYCPNIYGSCN